MSGAPDNKAIIWCQTYFLSGFDGLYWSFITATTVGYGDMRPVKKVSKLLAVLMAFSGLLFTGIMVAVAVQSASVAFEKHVDTQVIEQVQERFE